MGLWGTCEIARDKSVESCSTLFLLMQLKRANWSQIVMWCLVVVCLRLRNPTRIVSGTRKFGHVSPALKDLRWIPVKSHLYLRDAILAFKSMTGQVPNYLSSNFMSRGNISGRTTRSSSQLNIPLFKTKSGQRSFYYRTVTLWNALKPHFKLSESLIIFKRKMKAFLLNQF